MIRESARAARSQPVSSLLVAVVVTLTIATAVVTAGRTLQAERDALSTLDSAVTKTIEVIVTDGQGISTDEINTLKRVSAIDWVVGIETVEDLFSPVAGNAGPVPSYVVTTQLPPSVVTIEGRAPQPGEALVGAEATSQLGLPDGVGGLVSDDQDDIPAVGTIEAVSPLEELTTGVTRVADPDDDPRARRLLVQAASADQIAEVRGVVTTQLTDAPGREFDVGTDEGLATLRSALAGDLARGSRQILAGVTAAGALVVATVVFASVQSRRKDLGRRRALGASRTLVIGLLIGQTAIAAASGAVLAVIGGVAAAPFIGVSWTVSAAIAIISIAAAAVASIPPAVVAALRDPVRVLRTP